MVDNWFTFTANLEGGLIENVPPLEQGTNLPGSLRDAQNFEPSVVGGYKKVKGYTKFDTAAVPGTGDIFGVFAFKGKAIACRNDKIYESSGSGWTLIHTQVGTPITHYMVDRFNYGAGDKILLVDGTNLPITWDGTTIVTLAMAPPTATSVHSFANHIFFTAGSDLVFSAPNDETDYTVPSGGGLINTGTTKTGLSIWRDSLYVFGERRIEKLSGTNSSDFVRTEVTSRLGITTNKSIRELSGDVYYLSHDGVRTISGTDRIGDVQLESVTRSIPDTIAELPFLDSTFSVSSVVVNEKSQYRLFTGKSTAPDSSAQGILGGIRLNSRRELSLEWFKTKGFNTIYSDSDVFGNSELILHADFSGFVHQEETGSDFDGADINGFIRFPFWPFEDNEIRKTYYKGRIYIDANTSVAPILNYNLDYLARTQIQPAAINLGTGETGFAFYSDPSAVYGISIFGDDLPAVPEVNLIGSGNNVSFSITANDTLGEFSVQNITIEYATHDRR